MLYQSVQSEPSKPNLEIDVPEKVEPLKTIEGVDFLDGVNVMEAFKEIEA